MVAIIDYGVGNLFSLACSLKAIGQEVKITGNPDEIRNADRIILPGVGAFSDAAKALRESGMDEVIRKEAALGKPIMGICLGMQLLLEKSLEYGEHEGLGLIKGTVRPIGDVIPKGLKIPHIGWNNLYIRKECPMFSRINEGDFVYFVHSFFADVEEDALAAQTEYGAMLTAAVAKGSVFGCQFHPEKSGETGMNILRGFCEDL